MITNKKLSQVKSWLKRIRMEEYTFSIKWVKKDQIMLKMFSNHFHISDERVLYGVNIATIQRLAEAMYNMVLETVIHEMHEQFTIDNKRVMNPHFTGYTKL